MSNKADISVESTPVMVHIYCPICERESKMDYVDFCGTVGEPCDWEDTKFSCPYCMNEIEIGFVDWL